MKQTKSTQTTTSSMPAAVAKLTKTHLITRLIPEFPLYLAVENHPNADPDAVRMLGFFANRAFQRAWKKVPAKARKLVFAWFSLDWSFEDRGGNRTPYRSRATRRPWGLIRVQTFTDTFQGARDMRPYLVDHVMYLDGRAFLPPAYGWQEVSKELLVVFGVIASRMLPGIVRGDHASDWFRNELQMPLLGDLWADPAARSRWTESEKVRSKHLAAVRELLPGRR